MVSKLFLVIVLFFLTFPAMSFAQEVSPTPKPVEYELPYPGLLPDHPLYFLRAVRDTMQTLLTSNPVKKAEFHLLQADKGISASVLLSGKKETVQLGGATAIDSQKHFEKALDALESAKKQGLDTHELAKKMILASEKHQETLLLLENGAGEHAESYAQAAEKASEVKKRAKSFLPTK